VCLIAGAKVIIILRRFMALASAPTAIRFYLTLWTIACATMIGAFWLAD
jgi:hypothetical protein